MEELPFLECHRRVVEKATLLVRLEPVRVHGTRWNQEFCVVHLFGMSAKRHREKIIN